MTIGVTIQSNLSNARAAVSYTPRSLRGNLSYREVAKRTGDRISHSAVAQAEKGINTRRKPYVPSPETLKELAGVYHVSFDDLMMRAGYLINPTNVRTHPTSDGAKVTADVGFELSKQSIPVYGIIHAGEPTFADQHIIGETPVTDRMIDDYGKDNLFALQVKGDSMNRVVLPGYVAVFSKDAKIENGDIVAVLIDGDEAAIKRFRKTSRAVMFEPDSFNPIYQPIIFARDQDQDYRILGKFIYATSMPI
ncbi:helix-turn-helix domain-containing protein [Lentilactobacillus parabuchneri]|uniref:helix-turn-helix domain-containing protein n=1 Tax=Lentilactobacillus parabuchneri TaxID=152331 RepID=UPI000A248326|nr:LexA family transcriptional regulator [Lentilactobacillus parabuchneri]ORN02873.1 LexA repressor [Lentilactobacillus parabuchneri]